ncbi:MAG: SGNH/GDSL hydrolase family protein [Planctomycetota bacterium]|jgi:hypothetical protein
MTLEQRVEKPRRRAFPLLAKRLLLSLSSVLFALLVLECVFRLVHTDDLYPPPRKDVFIPLPGCPLTYVDFGFVPLARIRSTYPDNPRGYFDGGNAIDHDFNTAGWRDTEHAEKKPQGTYRILGLGDSFLFGQGVRFEDICLTRLARRLAARSPPGSTVEAINTGVFGFNTANERSLLRERGRAYDPDLVIVHFVPNDVERQLVLSSERPQVNFWIQHLPTSMEPDWLSQHSKLWGWARQRYLSHTQAQGYIESSLANYAASSAKWEFCRAALTEIKQICEREDCRLLIVIFPFFYDLDDDYPFQPIHDDVIAHCTQTGMHVLDLLEHFRGCEGPELWVHRVDPHPNEIAHRIAAEAMLEYFEEHASEFPGLPLGGR